MANRSKAIAMTAAAFGLLFGGGVLGSLDPTHELGLVLGGFLGYVICGARAMALWHLDDGVFERRRHSRRLTVAAVALTAVASAASAQQTIFNVPSADVLDPGKVYLEVDELFRPTDPEFSSTTVRGVFGVLPRMEAGVNFGGLNAPGPVIPTATVAVKLQPVRIGEFALTAGGNGLFFLKGSQDGNPAGLGYGFASYRIPKLGTRIELGGWYSSAGYALPTSTGGALATFEQPLPWIKGLTVAADWWSGENSIGYVSPGLIYAFGNWTAYAAYSIKNGDSRGNGGLIELGYLF
jgi:hypothetical protein